MTASFVTTGTGASSLALDLRRLVMKRRDLGTDQRGKVLVPELDRADVGAGLKDDGLVFCQELIDVHFHAIEIAEWRHRAHLAIGEQFRDFRFRRLSHIACF